MQKLKCLLQLIFTPGVGPATIAKLASKYKNPCYAVENFKEWFTGTYRLPIANREKEIEEILEVTDKNRLQAITIWDIEYPILLKEIHSPPPLLYLKGNQELVKSDGIAIVGTRHPSRYGREITRKIAGELSSAGLTIISGLALGIDGEAHKGALQNKGKTIAVLPSPLTQIIPLSHRKLAEEIVETGLLISETHPTSRLSKSNFYLRNRIISGLSKAVIVTEAPIRSGALITAMFALEQNREIYAVPGAITSEKSQGCNHLIKKGATPFLSSEDFLNDLGLQKNSHIIQLPELEENEVEILRSIGHHPTHFDEIIIKSNRSFGELTRLLMNLESKGYIEEIGVNFYKRKV